MKAILLPCIQAVDLAKTKIVSGGAIFTPEQWKAHLWLAMRNKDAIPLCNSSKLNLVKTMLLGRELEQDVWMWRKQILASRDEFCTVVNAELQEVIFVLAAL